MAVIWVKGAVLALAELIGAASLWMGYDLFLHGVVDRASGGVNYGTAKFWLTDAGPGIFFAAFGAAMVVFAVTRKLSYDRQATEQPDGFSNIFEHVTTLRAEGIARPNRSTPRDVILEPLPLKKARRRARIITHEHADGAEPD